jgi:hypothetical protein
MAPPDLSVDQRLLEALLADVLGKQLVLEPLKNVKSLKEELTGLGSRFDAVVLYGREPSPLIDSFLRVYPEKNHLLRMRVEDLGKRTPRRIEVSRTGLRYTLLEYPADTFYGNVPWPSRRRRSRFTVVCPDQDDWSAGLPVCRADNGRRWPGRESHPSAGRPCVGGRRRRTGCGRYGGAECG